MALVAVPGGRGAGSGPGAGVAEERGGFSAHHSSGLSEGLEKRKLCNQPTRCEVGAGVFP